jgi:Ino eighty subunit 1
MASRRQSPAPPKRSPLALKRADGDPLTRADIQYDVLNAIFSDKAAAFTDPYDSVDDAPKLCFRDLYIKAIMHSSKATKALKDKMSESLVFAEDFAMLGLLVNVGRINTTMSCEHDRFGFHSCGSLLTDAFFIQFFPK